MLDIWNELPEEVVVAGDTTTFKIYLHRCTDQEGLERHGPNAGRWAQCRWGRGGCFLAVRADGVMIWINEAKHGDDT